jgi:hypothetical protein
MTMARTDAGLVADDGGQHPDPEVPERARRRTFTAACTQEILAAYDAAPGGEKGAILRREGLYSSLITEWRRARDAGALAGLKQPRGRPAADPRDAQIARLQKEKAKLEQELASDNWPVPSWARKPERYSAEWWFVTPLRGMHATALQESPPSFRTRGVFITAGALSRV